MPLPDKNILQNNESRESALAKTNPILQPINLPRLSPNMPTSGGAGGAGSNNPVLDKALFLTSPKNPTPKLGINTVSTYNPTEIDATGRYNRWMLGMDNEDLQAGLQSNWDKAANGLLKGVGIAGTTFVQGTAGLVYGLGAAIGQGELNKFYNNDFSNYIEDLNKGMENALPNYYSAKEREADWYEPDNWFKANFFWDKIIKNLGFSAGAIGSGVVTGNLVGMVPKILGISKAGSIAKLSAALEEGLQGVPAAQKAAKAESIIMQNSKLVNIIDDVTAVNRAITSGLAASTEGGIEALQGMNEYRDKLIEDYKNANGKIPTGAELEAINNKSADLGNARFGLNMLLLTGTNYIQLPKILGASYSSSKSGLVNSVRRNAETGVLESALPTKGVSKLLYKSKNIAGLFVSPSEGFEEAGQFAAGEGVKHYYNKKNIDEDQSLSEFINSFSQAAFAGIKDLSSKEGMESILIGALSGGIQQARGEVKERGISGYGGEQAKNTQTLINEAAPFTLKGDKWLKDNIDSTKRAIVLQKDFETAVRQGDILEAKDAEFDYQHNYLMPRIKYGRFDLVKDDIAAYRKIGMTEEGIKELKEKGIASELDTVQTFQSRLTNFEKHANKVDSLTKSLNLRYGGLINTKTNKPAYPDEVIEKMIFSASKVADYEERSITLQNKLIAAGIDTLDINGSIQSSSAWKEEKLEKALAAGVAVIDSMDSIVDKDELKSDLIDYAEITTRRKSFLEEYENLKSSPEKYIEEEKPIAAKPITPSGTAIKIKTQTGEKDFEIGTEYIAGTPFTQSKEGADFQQFSRFTIEAETEDGQLSVRMTSNGKLMLIPKSAFEKYKIGQVSALAKKPNGAFYTEVAGKVFTYYIGKGKKAEKGHITYDIDKDRLYFQTLDGKRTYSVTRNQFVAKEGYSQAQIALTDSKLTPAAEAALAKGVSKEEIDKKYAAKDAVITELVQSSKKSLETINAKLEKAKEQLAAAKEALTNLTTTKKGLPKQRFDKAARKTIEQLSKTKDSLEKSIEALEEDKTNLEASIPYLEDMLQYKDELPEGLEDIVTSLKEDVASINEMIGHTEDAIKQGKSLLASVEELLLSALSLFNDYVKRLKEENPNIPLSIDALQERLEKFMGEQGAQQFIDQKLGYTQDVVDLQDSINDFREELKIPNMDKKAAKMSADISELEEGLKSMRGELVAKSKILEKFEGLVIDYQKRKVEEEAFKKNQNLVNSLLGTLNVGEELSDNRTDTEPEAKKADNLVVTSTITPSAAFSTEPLKPHHERSNRFGIRLPYLRNNKKIRGVLVSQANEGSIIPGLTNFLKGDSAANAADIITMVMVEQDGDKIYVVNEFGERIANKEELFDKAIFQVFPEPKNGKLEWSNGNSMFRKGTPADTVAYLTDLYIKWRKETLTNPALTPYEITPSLGQFQYDYTLDDKGNKVRQKTSNSAEDSGLIGENDLEDTPLIKIGKFDTETVGSTTFTNAKGKIFLNLPNGLVKLNNRKLTEEEASAVFDAVKRISTLAMENKMKTPEAERILGWLRSVVYWGRPQNEAGQSSLWFDKDANGGVVLNVGREGVQYEFTPTALDSNKSLVMASIKDMYNSVSSPIVTKTWADSYEQILSISDDGTVVSKKWNNYQTYLLSGKGRKEEEIPLTTSIRKVNPDEEVDDFNREGVYFTLKTNAANISVPKKAAEPVAKSVKPLAKTTTPAKGAKGAEEELTLGEDEEVQTGLTSAGEEFSFTAQSPTKIVLIEDANLEKIINRLLKLGTTMVGGKSVKVDREVAMNMIKQAAYNQLSKKGAQPAAKVTQKTEAEEEFTIGDDDTEVTADDTFVMGEDDSADVDADLLAELNEMPDEDEAPFRLQVNDIYNQFEGENWDRLSQWLKANFPNLPVYRVKNIIQATNGQQAWGMLKDSAIYLYENAEVGTAYHEVFEAVWKMFSSTGERISILKEFNERKGSFVDRPTGNIVMYSQATPQQAKEQLAEEFREFILTNKLPNARKTSFLGKLFQDIKNFFNMFFFGKDSESNTSKLFKKIGTGYYKQYSPYHSKMSFAKEGIIDIDEVFATDDSEFRVAGLTATESHEIMQQMTYDFITDVFTTNKSLYDMENVISKTELYDNLKTKVKQTVLRSAKVSQKAFQDGEISEAEFKKRLVRPASLRNIIENNWEELKNKHAEYMRIYGVEFDENDQAQLTDENNSGKEDYQDATKIDSFRKASSAIKVLLATLPEVNSDGSLIYSSIGGVKLLPLSKAFMAVMNNTHSARTIDEMVEKVREMSLQDPNYKRLYYRLTRADNNIEGQDFSNLDSVHDFQLLTNFFKVFKKQSALVKAMFDFGNGDVQIANSNFTTASRQIKFDMMSSVTDNIKSANEFFSYDGTKKAYIPKYVKRNGNDVKAISLININDDEHKLRFLDSLGIVFTDAQFKKMSVDQKNTFREAVNGIYQSISKVESLYKINSKTLSIEGRLGELSEIKAALENPEFDSTYFNVNNEIVQSFIGVNLASNLYDQLSQITNLQELGGTPFAYLLRDKFSANSVILNKMFNMQTGKRKAVSKEMMKVGYVDGAIKANGKKKESAKQTYRERLIQEINMNFAGIYYTLVAGDASMEHMINMGNHITPKMLSAGNDDTNEIFKGYFISELNLSRENRRIVDLKGRNTTDLRFFKGILGTELHDKIVKTKGEPEEVYKKYKTQIDKAVNDFLESETKELVNSLRKYEIINPTDEGLSVAELTIPDNNNTSLDNITFHLKVLTTNYVINNIEQHKLIFSDPYLYKDELKRIKNFDSPRQAVVSNSVAFNAGLDRVWNSGYSKSDIGYTDMNKDYLDTVTLEDVESIQDLDGYDNPDDAYTETDGGGIISMKAYRNFRIRAANWNALEEKQYKYDVAYEKRFKDMPLSAEEAKLLAEGMEFVKSAYTPLKPITAGNRENEGEFNDILLDKFALYPLSFRIMNEFNPDSNAVKFYNKMQEEGIDYAVFSSGRKVGADGVHPLYNEDGTFNTESFSDTTKIKVPFAIIAIQSEVPSKTTSSTPRGTQITRLATLDTMAGGVPIDFLPNKSLSVRFAEWSKLSPEEKNKSEVWGLIKNNQALLEEMTQLGYQSLLDKLGITEENGSFVIEDREKTAKTLREEILKREVNDNILSALEGFLGGDVILEATPAYQQIRNILYSIIDKSVVSPKINGGQRVQIASTLLESLRIKPKKVKGKTVFTSDELSFYKNEDGKRVCEIYIGRWFNSNMSDKGLLDYLNNTEEGKKLLSGVGFRIPSQKQNSLDSFVIKGFLPKEFGDSVVIPSALVKKSGSDFDIDKLTVYLKNIISSAGKLITLPNFDTKEENISALEDIYFEKILQTKIDKANTTIIKQDNLQTLFSDLSLGLTSNKVSEKWIPIFKEIFSDFVVDDKLNVRDVEESFMNRLISTQKRLDKLTDYDLQQVLAQEFVESNYKKIVENKYIESLQTLISHPLNFKNLTKPNSAAQLKAIAKTIVKKTNQINVDNPSTKDMMNRGFMSSLRQAFVRGKYAIGIAARAQTQNSLNQRSLVVFDPERIENQDDVTKFWLGNGRINLPHNDVVVGDKTMVTLSAILNKAGDNISDIISQFIDGYVDISKGPWIMQMGATPSTAGTWLFLVQAGVPIKDIAFFMNQPIIRDYLTSLENSGYTWVFNDKLVGATLEDYGVSEQELEKIEDFGGIDFEANLGKTEFNAAEKREQGFILMEFLKYSQMASQYYVFSQGNNYDTANLNDPYLVFKKNVQYARATQSIFTSAEEMMDNSFLGDLQKSVNNSRDAVADTVLMSDKSKVREVLQTVLFPFIDSSDKNFVKTARKAVSDLFDWAVQINLNVNTSIKKTLVDKEGSVKKVATFINKVKNNPKHPLYNNHVINILQPVIGSTETATNNLKIANRDNKIYDQNQVIYGFEEIRDYTKSTGDPIFQDIVNVSILQSGLSNSPLAFTSLLPYDTIKKVYNDTLVSLENMPNLGTFATLNVYQRNNWADTDAVPYVKAPWIKVKGKWKYNPSMQFLHKKVKKAINDKTIPQVISLSIAGRSSQADVITYSWEVGTSAEKKKMRDAGDFSYIKKGLFKKVYDEDGRPFITETNKKKYYTFKMINAWGDSYRGNEFYDVAKKSVMDNGYEQADEVSDKVITPFFAANTTAPKTGDKLVITEETPAMAYSTTITNIDVDSVINSEEFKAYENKNPFPPDFTNEEKADYFKRCH